MRYLGAKMDPLNVQLHVSLVVETLPTGMSLRSQNYQQNNKKGEKTNYKNLQNITEKEK